MIELAIVLVVKLKLEWNQKEAEDFFGESQQISKSIKKKFGFRRRKIVQLNQLDTLWNSFEKRNAEKRGHKFSGSKQKGNWITSSATNKIDFASLAIFLTTYFLFNLIYYCHYVNKGKLVN